MNEVIITVVIPLHPNAMPNAQWVQHQSIFHLQ